MQEALTRAAYWAASSRRFATHALSGSFVPDFSSSLGNGGPYAAFQDASLAAGLACPCAASDNGWWSTHRMDPFRELISLRATVIEM